MMLARVDRGIGGTTKPDLVLLHGWGASSSVWGGFEERLQQHFRVHKVDLPGHGAQRDFSVCDGLQDWAAFVARDMPEHAIWVGWSLGGLVALQVAALYPERIARLVLLGSSPRFVQSSDWPNAVSPQVFTDFQHAMEQDATGLMSRFFALQTLGAHQSGELRRRLKLACGISGEPVQAALARGLCFLQDCDLRDVVRHLTCKSLFLLGDRDYLVPVGVSRDIQRLNPDIQVNVIEGGAHVFFMSHPQRVLTEMLAFCR